LSNLGIKLENNGWITAGRCSRSD